MAMILVVDDSAFMRSSLKYIVENVGHSVVALAKEGGEAVELYRKLKPDLVTLDVLMGGMDGFSALKMIMEEDPKAKGLMVTAVGNEDKQEEALEIGASGYIRKPFKQAEIVDEINRVLS